MKLFKSNVIKRMTNVCMHACMHAYYFLHYVWDFHSSMLRRYHVGRNMHAEERLKEKETMDAHKAQGTIPNQI